MMYPEATIPAEFSALVKEKYPAAGGELIYPGLLLTMACQQGYRIEHVTDSYVILAKFIYKKEQKEKPNETQIKRKGNGEVE